MLIDADDLTYVESRLPGLRLSSITFWLSGGVFIGTSAVAKERYWIDAATGEVCLCIDRRDLLRHIKPQVGEYLIYTREDEGFVQLGPGGKYDHTNVLMTAGRYTIPEILREEVMRGSNL